MAVASTGIGLLIVALGAIYTLWQDFGSSVKSSESNFTRFKATLMGGLNALWSLTKDYYSILFKLVTFDFPGALEVANNSGKAAAKAYSEGRAGVIAEARRAELKAEADQTARYLDILKARGTDTLALEVANAAKRLEAEKVGSKERLDATAAYLVLKAQLEKRADDEHKAGRLAHLTALTAAETARGASTFASQFTAKREQMAQLNQLEAEGAHVAQAQRIQLESELNALVLAHDKELADKRAALQGATLQAQLVRLQASTTEQSLVEVEANNKQIEIAKAHRATLLAQAQVDKAAVVAADAELYKLRLDRSRIFYRQEAEQAQALRAEYDRALDALRAKEVANEKQYQARLNQAQAAGARVTKQIADELAAELGLKAMKAAAEADLGGNLLIKLFGLTDAQAQEVKKRLGEMAAQVSALTSVVLQGAAADADAALTATQARLAEVSQQLSEASAARESTQSQIDGATGARKDYLLGKLEKERVAEQKLANEKAKAAKEEQQAQKEKAKLDKVQQEITAGTSAVEAVLLGIKAAKAVVEASSHGKVGYDNIALALAASIAIGASIVSMKNLAKFADGTGALGGDGVLAGPAHAQGGIGIFNRYGHFFGEAEGGEAISPADASRLNAGALQLIRTKGRSRQLTAADFAEIGNMRVLPPPSGGYYANGTGALSRTAGAGATIASGGQVVIAATDLSDLIETNRAMLAHLQAINGATAQTAAKPPLIIGPYEARKIEEERQNALLSESFATL